MSDLFGWDLVYKVSESNINKKEDLLTLLIHFLLLKNGFKCVGLGDSNSSKDEQGSEFLPVGWSDSNCYSIRYTCDKLAFVLRSIPVNNSLVFNLLDTASLAVSNVVFIADDEINNLKGDLKTIYRDSDNLIKKILSSLINPVKERSKDNCEATTQTSQSDRYSDPSPLPPINLVQPQRSESVIEPLRDPLRVGSSDLNPLGGLGGFHDGGGMIFNPFENRPQPDLSGLPRGSVPPGARFDPFAPPNAGQGPRRPNRGPPDFDMFDPFGGSGRRPFGNGPGGPHLFM